MRGFWIIPIITAVLILGMYSDQPAFAKTYVERVDKDSHPPIPEESKVSCYENGERSSTCPVLKSDGFTYWAFSYKDNTTGMMIVKYDDSGNVVDQWSEGGARYVYAISVDATEKTVTFWGQADRTIVMSWGVLGITSSDTIPPPVIEPTTPPETEPTTPPDTESTTEEKTQEKIPGWIKNIFAFYVDGSIDEDALINALKWLINEGIIQLED